MTLQFFKCPSSYLTHKTMSTGFVLLYQSIRNQSTQNIASQSRKRLLNLFLWVDWLQTSIKNQSTTLYYSIPNHFLINTSVQVLEHKIRTQICFQRNSSQTHIFFSKNSVYYINLYKQREHAFQPDMPERAGSYFLCISKNVFILMYRYCNVNCYTITTAGNILTLVQFYSTVMLMLLMAKWSGNALYYCVWHVLKCEKQCQVFAKTTLVGTSKLSLSRNKPVRNNRSKTRL